MSGDISFLSDDLEWKFPDFYYQQLDLSKIEAIRDSLLYTLHLTFCNRIYFSDQLGLTSHFEQQSKVTGGNVDDRDQKS